MRIVQIITGLFAGGAERVVADLSAGLRARGHDVTLISLQPLPVASPALETLRRAQVPVQSLRLTRTTPWRVFGLGRMLREMQPALVHAHLIHANLASRLASPRSSGTRTAHPDRLKPGPQPLGVQALACSDSALVVQPREWRLVNTVHIAERRRGKGWHFLLDRWTLSRCDLQTAVSGAVRDFHAGRLEVPPATLPVVYNGIRAPRQPTPAEIAALRQSWGVADCTRVIGAVGRLDWQKGFDRLLGRLPALATAMPPGERWGVVILGEGPERRRLERLALRSPQNTPVRLPGFRADAADCLGAFDLFVMPSRYEGFGLTLAEAMAHGVPVLASRVDSLPELLDGYANGATWDFTQPAGAPLADEIRRLAARTERTPSLRFTLDAMVDGYLRLYAGLRGECG